MASSDQTTQTISGDHRKPLVLVVDDDVIYHKLFTLIADRLDITAHLVASCAEAMDAIGVYNFDMILMDCRMPGVDGYECTARIRRLDGNIGSIPIIAVTACVLPGDREKCIESGMNDFLGKPFTLEQLHQKIFQWLPDKSPTHHDASRA